MKFTTALISAAIFGTSLVAAAPMNGLTTRDAEAQFIPVYCTNNPSGCKKMKQRREAQEKWKRVVENVIADELAKRDADPQFIPVYCTNKPSGCKKREAMQAAEEEWKRSVAVDIAEQIAKRDADPQFIPVYCTNKPHGC